MVRITETVSWNLDYGRSRRRKPESGRETNLTKEAGVLHFCGLGGFILDPGPGPRQDPQVDRGPYLNPTTLGNHVEGRGAGRRVDDP